MKWRYVSRKWLTPYHSYFFLKLDGRCVIIPYMEFKKGICLCHYNPNLIYVTLMTRKILMGLVMATILFTLGSSAQSFAMPVADKTQSDMLVTAMTGNLTFNGQQYELVGIPSTHKGEAATYQLIPKPIELPDSQPVPKISDPHPLMLVGITPLHKGETATYQLIPKPDPDPKDFTS